jgi:Na+/proline symporter
MKEAIWMIMAVNLGAMMYRRKQAVKALASDNLPRAKAMLEMISKYMVPLNIVLGLCAIFMGVVLRNAY